MPLTTLRDHQIEIDQILHDAVDVIKTAIQCVEYSTEYKIGNPAFEQCATNLRKSLKRMDA